LLSAAAGAPTRRRLPGRHACELPPEGTRRLRQSDTFGATRCIQRSSTYLSCRLPKKFFENSKVPPQKLSIESSKCGWEVRLRWDLAHQAGPVYRFIAHDIGRMPEREAHLDRWQAGASVST